VDLDRPCCNADQDREERLFLSVLLFASFAVSMVAWLYDSLDKLVLMDGAIFAYALSMWMTRRGLWRAQFLCFAAAQVALDFLKEAYGPAYIVPYAWAYDATFLGELAIVSGGGWTNVLVGFGRWRVRAWLRLLPGFGRVSARPEEVTGG
jgi:hypothetical protein